MRLAAYSAIIPLVATHLALGAPLVPKRTPSASRSLFTSAGTDSNSTDTGSGSNSTIDSSPDSNSSGVSFAADPSINVAGIYAAAQSAKGSPLPAGSYPTSTDSDATQVQIYGDWLTLGSGSANGSSTQSNSSAPSNSSDLDSRASAGAVSAFHFIADMDIDCDGPDENCAGNPDGQSLTSFGALDASKVPYFVIPETFTEQNQNILMPNALGAIICDGKMYYGIYGDQNGDTPEAIGEASILVGQTCFPNATINGAQGHDAADVAYIVFGEQVPSGVGNNTIDIAALKTLGDTQVKSLQSALGL
ncbi:fungal chitosanase of glycosyl hydrolase group 75-domain-containing protein [Mycena maculata]|uniref:Endo-chitosanase n=1 Tax=Mycena maculata TaxID=230809 RepID=A0AAD7IHE2_9AGAR|nr:fungal chitosanase of glycosyl hydrolase group 75-domain-containing protein [Mycena maculata]